MKALYLTKNGNIDSFKYDTDFPVPEIKPDEVLVKIKATSVNRVDIVIRNGYPGLNLNFPHITGGDISGIIESTGNDVRMFKSGDRVLAWPLIVREKDKWTIKNRPGLSPGRKFFGMQLNGSYAEYTAVPENSLIRLPDNVSFEDAACLPIAGLTAYHALFGVGNIQPGQNFFIWGGTSGLGTIAVQLAKSAGAKVFATGGNDEKMEFVKNLGADYVFNHYENKNILNEVLDITNGTGIDVVLDYVGPDSYETSFNMLTNGGKLLWCGMITGRETTVSIHQTYFRHLSIMGLFLGEKFELEALLKFISERKIKPVIHKRLELQNAGEGHTLMESGKIIGKVILKP